jgi:hypothetical protein
MHITRIAAIAAVTLALNSVSGAAQSLANAPVTEAELRTHIVELASDRYGGRRPGTEGETLTAHYIAQQLALAGFVAGGEGPMGWYAPVPLIELTPISSAIDVRRADGSAVALNDEFVLRAPSGRARIENGEAVFVGYGMSADGRVADAVRGRIAIVLASERDQANAQGLRARRDALIRGGAIAVLVISDIDAPFPAFRQAYSSGAIQIAEPLNRVQMDGLVSEEFGAQLLDAGGISPTDAGALASEALPARLLTVRLSLTAESSARAYNSYNVVARLPGRRSGSGAVLLTGHWDHLGQCRPEGATDRICNGAVDNASGIAVLIETARRLGAGPQLDRDVWIVATTAEESGLLGAHWFADHSPVPLDQIQVVLNVDTVAIAPRGATVAIVGRGTTDYDDDVEAVAAQLGRRMQDGDEANAFIRRQDGWAFTQRGVPAIMAGGSFSDSALLQAFLSGPYHKPDDEFTEALPLGGAADDADLHVALTRRLATVRLSPARQPRRPAAQ